jgi:uncharacterized repeat protein (TIGR01451 family)
MKKIFTKTVLVLALLGLSFNDAKAQYVTIPDVNFKNWLTTTYPACMIGNQMDTTCAAIVNETSLIVTYTSTSYPYITDFTGIQYFDNLQTLNCYGNNSLGSLPPLPNTLLNLDVNGCELTSLPPLPSGLLNLSCRQNQISVLPVLPNSLLRLDCSMNFITVLPQLPGSLKSLSCFSNQLTSLPILPDSLKHLNFYNNQITILPSFPNSLDSLSFEDNPVVSCPTLPNHLIWLYFGANPLLTSIPPLPNTLLYLRFYEVDLHCLPILPSSLLSIDTWDLPSLNCVPNQVTTALYNSLSFYPICVTGDSIHNPYGCSNETNITGNVYKDIDSNCILNVTDPRLANIPIKFYNIITNQFGMTYTDINGVFYYACQPGNYIVNIDTLNKPYTINCNNPGFDTTLTTSLLNPVTGNINIEANCKTGLDLNVQSVNHKDGLIFPGQQHTLQVMVGDASQWYRLNCANGSSGQVQITITGPVTYNGVTAGALLPNINGNVYSYSIADFGVINNATDFQLLFTVDTNALAGNQICVHAEITPNSGDFNLSNNIKDYCYNVVNSYDPNNKEVYPTDVPPLFQDWLTYTIHFQNLGTAPAINIRLLDTLDSNLDAETFEVINYSHYNTVNLMDGILDFRFPNILLPDSASNPSGSQGFVQYRIKPKANLTAGTQIENTAHIYFDFNPAVVTNTTVNNFTTTVGNAQRYRLPIAIGILACGYIQILAQAFLLFLQKQTLKFTILLVI